MTLALQLPAFVGPNVASLKTVLVPGLPAVSLPPLRAYGMRSLWPAYSGAFVRLRRSSDDAEQDFQFLSDAVSWAAAASAFVKTFYDQSGNGKHLVAPANVNQARIINAGVLDTIGPSARPHAVFDGANHYYVCVGGHGMYAPGAVSVFALVDGGTGVSAALLCEGSSASANPVYNPVGFFSATLTQQISNDGGVSLIPFASVAELPAALVSGGDQITTIDTGSVFKKRVNSTALADIAYARSGTMTVDRLSLGARVKTSVQALFKGGFSEIVAYPFAASASERDAIEANQNAYR